MNEQEPHLVEVYDGLSLDALMLQSMLEDAGIEVYVFDGAMGTLAPWNAAPGGVGGVRLMVSSDSEELARKIVAEFEANIKPE